MVNLLGKKADKAYVRKYYYQTPRRKEMSLLNSKTLINGVSSMGLERMIIPSILLHLAIIALVIVAPTLYVKRTSYPQMYMVSLVLAPSDRSLWLGEERINKEVRKIEHINTIKNPQKVVKVENKKIAVPEPETEVKPEPQAKSKPEPEPKSSLVWSISEPEERIKTGYPGLPEQRGKELTDRDGGSLYGVKANFEGQQGGKELTDRDGALIIYSLSNRKPVLPSTAPSFIENPKPHYPMIAIMRKMEGVVLLRVEVLADGIVGKIEVKRSSGYRILDESALRAVKKWRFSPATLEGVSVKVWASIPIRFELGR